MTDSPYRLPASAQADKGEKHGPSRAGLRVVGAALSADVDAPTERVVLCKKVRQFVNERRPLSLYSKIEFGTVLARFCVWRVKASRAPTREADTATVLR